MESLIKCMGIQSVRARRKMGLFRRTKRVKTCAAAEGGEERNARTNTKNSAKPNVPYTMGRTPI